MTEWQDNKYWRRWNACVRANHWRMAGGRLDERAAGPDRSETHADVWRAAEQIALRKHRAVIADDLRHGCHVVALGRDKSHTKLSNREFDKVLTLWGDERDCKGLLIEPLHLGSEIHNANPDIKSRRRHLHFLTHECLGGYVASECERIYGTKDFESLVDAQLMSLSDHIRNRPRALKKIWNAETPKL